MKSVELPKLIKTSGFYLVQIVLTLILAEGVSYFFLKNSSNSLYRTRRILQSDSVLGWRQQSGLSTSFEGAQLVTNQNGFRQLSSDVTVDLKSVELLTLGPSSAFGWGVEAEQTYSHLAAHDLKLSYLNASQIGHSVLQGRLLFENHLLSEVQPKVVLIAFGINDLDRIRFYTSGYENDLEYFSSKPIRHSALVGFERYSNLLTLVSMAINESRLKRDCSPLKRIEQRLSLSAYLGELETLVASIKAMGAHVVLINTPYLFPMGRSSVKDQINQYYSEAEQQAKNEKCKAALDYFAKAKALETERISEDVLELNLKLRQSFSAREGVTLIDAYSLLGHEKSNFVDPVHPSFNGHQIISRQIIESVMKLRR